MIKKKNVCALLLIIFTLFFVSEYGVNAGVNTNVDNNKKDEKEKPKVFDKSGNRNFDIIVDKKYVNEEGKITDKTWKEMCDRVKKAIESIKNKIINKKSPLYKEEFPECVRDSLIKLINPGEYFKFLLPNGFHRIKIILSDKDSKVKNSNGRKWKARMAVVYKHYTIFDDKNPNNFEDDHLKFYNGVQDVEIKIYKGFWDDNKSLGKCLEGYLFHVCRPEIS